MLQHDRTMSMMTNISHLYFIGIGGIGMSALARYCQGEGKMIYGYDKTPSDITAALQTEGMRLTFTDTVSEIPSEVLTAQNTLVVYTPAIPESNTILSWFRANEFNVLKRAALLGDITKHTTCLAVAGTHGKTTTSAILGHLMAACDMPVTAFLGGIAENYHSNFIQNGTDISVVEADEFDRSFLQLSPDIACVTSMDADHLDIYGDSNAIEAAFKAFSELLPKKENLLFKKGLPLEGQTVAVGEEADFEARNVRIEDGCYVFDLKTPTELIRDMKFCLPGHHNLHNAVTALGMAISAGTPTHGLPKALANFRGVERRFSYRIKEDDLVLIDDYAHHPTEIDALHQAVEEMYPEEQKLIVFQPHLFSRTSDFGDGFARSLEQFDEVVLMHIYPAREEPIPGIDSAWLLSKVQHVNKQLVNRSDLADVIGRSSCRIKLMVGAGDIGAEVPKVVEKLGYEA